MASTDDGFSFSTARPFGLPAARAETLSGEAAGSAKLPIRVLTIAFALTVFTQKLAVPIGEKGLQIALLIAYGSIALLLISGNATISTRKLFGYLALVFIYYFVSTINNNGDMSLSSLLLLTGIYLVYIFDVDIDSRGYVELLRNFQKIGVIVALLVYSNWLCNFIGVAWPNLNEIVPVNFLFKNYVYIQPVEWGSPYTKPNAIFFLETSHTGQFLAMILIIEICLFQRVLHTLVFSTALISTLSGTGILLFVVSVPFILPYLNSRLIIAGLVALPLAAGTALSIGLLDNALKRSTEFSRSGTSGNGRFVAPFEASVEFLSEGGAGAFIGMGAGKKPFKEDSFFLTPPISKVLFEYGVVASLALLLYTVLSVCGSGVPFVICWAALIQYHLLNGSALVPVHTLYCYFLAGAFSLPRGSVQAAFRQMRHSEQRPGVSRGGSSPAQSFQAEPNGGQR